MLQKIKQKIKQKIEEIQAKQKQQYQALSDEFDDPVAKSIQDRKVYQKYTGQAHPK